LNTQLGEIEIFDSGSGPGIEWGGTRRKASTQHDERRTVMPGLVGGILGIFDVLDFLGLTIREGTSQ
jgi:hypothetical protein